MRALFQRLPLFAAMMLAVIWTLPSAHAAERDIVVQPTSQLPGNRVAFVVGVSHYSRGSGPIYAPDLRNPINDAQAMRDMLSKLGFFVIYGEDLGKDEFETALDHFEDRARGADIALVYFSGHGATFEDLPYLVPADATFDELRQTERKLVKVEDVLQRLRQAKGVRIALFDACRDNDAEQALKQRAAGTKGVVQSRGLARISSADGLIVMYAAQHLQTASDGSEVHSPFAAALLDKLPTPNIDITTTLQEAARAVIEKSGGAQKPELVVDLFDKFVLVPGEQSLPPSPPDANKSSPDPRIAEAAAVWQALQSSTDLAALAAFKQRYAGTLFEIMASDRIAKLKLDPSNIQWQTFRDDRYGVAFDVPITLVQQARADAGNGSYAWSSVSDPGAPHLEISLAPESSLSPEQLRTETGFSQYEAIRKQQLAGMGWNVTYEDAKPNFYVASGFVAGQIGYLRVVHADYCPTAMVATLYYSPADKDRLDPIVERISRSLVANAVSACQAPAPQTPPPIVEPAPPQPKKWRLAQYSGFDFFGGDLSSAPHGFVSQTEALCAQACANDTGCNLYTYNAKGHYCFVKNTYQYTVYFDGAAAGYLYQAEDNAPPPLFPVKWQTFAGYDLPGGDIAQLRGIATPDQCLAACNANETCQAFTFSRQSAGTICFLKNNSNLQLTPFNKGQVVSGKIVNQQAAPYSITEVQAR